MMKVPFNDLGLHHKLLQPELNQAIAEILEQSAFIRGREVDLFEKEFAAAVSAPFCVSCANGTDALYIAMKSLGLNNGDEVIVPSHSWISTSETVTQAGGKVVFCDTREDNHTIDADQISDLITNRTVGIIPVHLFGHPADMAKIMQIARQHGLWVIEDCAQAHLAKIDDQFVGTFGDVGTFSFYPGKNLGAIGDAGALVTANEKLAMFAASFARHGGLVKGDHQIEGINSRLDGIQAAVLNIKLPRLAAYTSQRQDAACRYRDLLHGIPQINLPSVGKGSEHVWHLYVLRAQRRDELCDFLADNNIATVINYRTCLPLLPAYARLKHSPSDFPVAARAQDEIVSIPIYPEIKFEQQQYVASKIREFYSK